MHALAIGSKMPAWVNAGVEEYCKRLPSPYSLQFHELPLPKRSAKSDLVRLVAEEGASMIAAIPEKATVIALDERGASWSTEDLAKQLAHYSEQGKPLYFLIGGPDGLAPHCKARAEKTWSLSKLTLPHPIVRIILAEAIYRAWSVLQGHPYHRFDSNVGKN